ncbi:MAG: WG repeat-containing protein, partial [Flavobacteriales bacterium]
VKKNGKYGFIDHYGNTVLPFQLDDSHDFENGLVTVASGDGYGRIDAFGEVCTPFVFDRIHETFRDRSALVEQDGKRFFVDDRGRYLKS